MVALRDRENLEKTGIEIFNAGPVKRPRRAGTESAECRNGKSCRIEIESGRTCAGEKRGVRGGACVWIADAIRTAGMIWPRIRSVGCSDGEWNASLQGENAIQLPPA